MRYHLVMQTILLNALRESDTLTHREWNEKPSAKKWSKKEVLGHLIDSAYNNHQRIIRFEAQKNLCFYGYDQDDWVIKNNYQRRDIGELLKNWEITNRHLAALIESIPQTLMHKEFIHHNLHQICMNKFPADKKATLSYLIWDYLFHLEHHLVQILPNYEKIHTALKRPGKDIQCNRIKTAVSWWAIR
ncbi:MAG: DinB family protein [Bacteroidota bacterium]